jgi:serine/threonine protein phosphatase PrpC
MARCRTPGCTEDNPPDARYCGECGASLLAKPPQAIEPPADPRAHVEIEAAPELAAVSDVGCNPHHTRNEDCVGVNLDLLATGAVQIMIVADGVSRSQSPEEASRIAVETAGAALVSATRQLADAPAVMCDAILEAHHEICRLPYDPSIDIDAPGATIVAALVARGRVLIGWSGDSRAYWIGPESATQLTRDHSYAEREVAAGHMSEAEAMKLPLAHAITQCLGMVNYDAPPEPDVITLAVPPEGGRLLLCSDGLWNYLAGPAQLYELLAAPGGSALDQARMLVDFARDAGGSDNISAALLVVPAAPRLAQG